MKDIKDILVFLSLSLKIFLSLVFFNFLYLLMSIMIIFGLFFVSPAPMNHLGSLLLLLISIIASHIVFKNIFLFKYQWLLNFRFINFLGNNPSPNPQITIDYERGLKLPIEEIKSQYKAVKSGLKPRGLALFSKMFVISLIMTLITREHPFNWNRCITENLKKCILKLYLLNLLIFFMILVMFTLISFLLTIGIRLELKLLIFFIGFLFAYFLHAALFDPIVSLMIQKQTYLSVSQS